MDQTILSTKEYSGVEPPLMSEGLTEDDQMRANVYGLLATLLARPADNTVLDLLKSIDAGTPADTGTMGVSWQLLKSASDRFSAAEIDDEYHALFIGVGRGEMVPFGSWYMTGFLMEKPLSALRTDLLSLGIERGEGVYESEDHIASLCETMSTIIRFPDEIDWQTQRAFFDNHLAPWAGKFFEDLQTAQCARFYRSVGHVGQSFIAIEKQYLSMAV